MLELENRVKEQEEILHSLRERSGRLVDMERRRCLEYVPSKGNSLLFIIISSLCLDFVAVSLNFVCKQRTNLRTVRLRFGRSFK